MAELFLQLNRAREASSVGAVWEGGAEDRAGPSRVHADAMAPPRQPCVGPTYMTPNLEPGAEALPPTPARTAWCRYKVHLRSLQVLKHDQVQCFGLEGCPVGSEATVRVVLVLCPDPPCCINYGSLEVLYIAKRRSGAKGKWGLTDADGYRRTIWKWVEEQGLLLTGRCKAHRGPVVTGPHLLVLEVQPQPQAAAPTGQTTASLDEGLNRAGPSQPAVGPTLAAGSDGSLHGAGPSQADAAPAPAAGGTAGASSGRKKRRTGVGSGQAEAPAQRQQEQERGPETPPGQTGPARGGRPSPAAAPVQVPGAGQPSSAERLHDAGGATAGGGLGAAEEGGPGQSHAAAGIGGDANEGDPVVPPPAGGPATPAAQTGPGAGRPSPSAAAPAPAVQEACRPANGTAGTHQGQSQQSGKDDGAAREGMEADGEAAQVSGQSVPSLAEGHVDAGYATVDEGDPIVLPPAAAPSHAGLAGSYGQGVTDPMASTQEEPEVHREVAMGWAELIRTVFLKLDKHLPQKRQSKVVDAQMRFDQWCDGGEGLTHLQALAKAHTTVQNKCAHFSPEHKAKYLWELVQKAL